MLKTIKNIIENYIILLFYRIFTSLIISIAIFIFSFTLFWLREKNIHFSYNESLRLFSKDQIKDFLVFSSSIISIFYSVFLGSTILHKNIILKEDKEIFENNYKESQFTIVYFILTGSYILLPSTSIFHNYLTYWILIGIFINGIMESIKLFTREIKNQKISLKKEIKVKKIEKSLFDSSQEN